MKIKAIFSIAALLASMSSFAANKYQVSTSIYSDSMLVASPTMVVEADKVASISLGTDLRYDLTINPKEDKTAGVMTTIKIGDNTISPAFNVTYGKEASIEVGSQKLTIIVDKIAE